jgi:hypothetical protein
VQSTASHPVSLNPISPYSHICLKHWSGLFAWDFGTAVQVWKGVLYGGHKSSRGILYATVSVTSSSYLATDSCQHEYFMWPLKDGSTVGFCDRQEMAMSMSMSMSGVGGWAHKATLALQPFSYLLCASIKFTLPVVPYLWQSTVSYITESLHSCLIS